MTASSPSFLLKFQIGPVQEFIAQARSTRDLWSGSYLLSFLVAAGIRELRRNGGTLIFPNPDRQPLLDAPPTWHEKSRDDQTGLLTPNLPNLFVAEIPGENPGKFAGKIASAIESQWTGIAETCFSKLESEGILESEWEADFLAQAGAFLSIAWQATPLGEDYLDAYQQNGIHLDAVRQTRDFRPDPVCKPGEKDSLSGKDFAFVRGKDAAKNCYAAEYRQFFKHDDDHLSAITLIKRVWHLAYLKDEHGLKTASGDFIIRSTRAIAARSNDKDDEENTDTAIGDKYLAAIAFDGDSIGKWVNGDPLTDKSGLRSHHADFSAALSNFSLGGVRPIVEPESPGKDHKNRDITIPLGFLIYAGGDDVVALVPADAALEVAVRLRDAFVDATKDIHGRDEQGAPIRPDASAGIAIAHFKSPLQDLIRAAQVAEKRAKNTVGRPAFSITLMKRSGEISHWGAKWNDGGGIALHDAILRLMEDGGLSTRFPHRVCQLLTPHLTATTGLSNQSDVLDKNTACDLITREFLHAARQQGSNRVVTTLGPLLDAYLQGVLNAREERKKKTGRESPHTIPQELLQSVLGLCTAVAFVDRNRSGNKPKPH